MSARHHREAQWGRRQVGLWFDMRNSSVITAKTVLHSLMSKCPYCGRENEKGWDFCLECGTELPQETSEPTQKGGLQAASVGPALNAHRATRVLLSFLAAQVIGGLVVGFIGLLVFQSQHIDLRKARYRREFLRTIFEPIVAAATIGGGAALALASRSLPREEVMGGEATEAAWRRGSPRWIAMGVAAGAVLGACALGLPTSRAVSTGWLRALTVFSAVVLAPPVEELLFRGLLYAGYCQSYGPTWAAIITTGLFWSFHLIGGNASTITILFIPAMALLALWFRIQAQSVGPAVAVHFGYNAALAIGWTVFR
jgi:membrane protease YdiL (CAAX protease family)